MWSHRKMRNVKNTVALENIQSLLSDSEALLKATASEGGERIQEIRHRFEKSLRVAQDALAEAEGTALRRTLRAARVTDVYAHDHPWRVVLTGMTMGLLIGLLARSR